MESREIYDAKVIFKDTKYKGVIVSVHTKTERSRKAIKKIVPLPDEIKVSDLGLQNINGQMMVIYYRIGSYKYKRMDGMHIPTDFGQKLESIILSVL